MNIYNELNDDIHDENVSDEDIINMNKIINDLEEISARIIDDVSIFESSNNLQLPTLLEIFNLQLIEIALVKGIDLIL